MIGLQINSDYQLKHFKKLKFYTYFLLQSLSFDRFRFRTLSTFAALVWVKLWTTLYIRSLIK